MRAAATLSVAIIAIGAFLLMGATFALSPSLIALGVVLIAVTTAIAIAMEPKRAPSH